MYILYGGAKIEINDEVMQMFNLKSGAQVRSFELFRDVCEQNRIIQTAQEMAFEKVLT